MIIFLRSFLTRTALFSGFLLLAQVAQGAVKVAPWLVGLVDPIENCVNRNDTDHPVFDGCVDWHSALHANWALYWSSFQLHDAAIRDRVLARLSRHGLESERKRFKRIDEFNGNFEMPYGRAWLLHFARDMGEMGSDERLHGIAEDFYPGLLSYSRKSGNFLLNDNYRNGAWYLMNLKRWAEYQGHEEDVEALQSQLAFQIESIRAWPRFHEVTGFFAPKYVAMMAACDSGLGLDQAGVRRLVEAIEEDDISPVSPPFDYLHQAGLNYSRAWGLWATYVVTGNIKFKQAWQFHMDYMEKMKPEWSENYAYSHWVGQFGVFSLRAQDLCNKPASSG